MYLKCKHLILGVIFTIKDSIFNFLNNYQISYLIEVDNGINELRKYLTHFEYYIKTKMKVLHSK